MFLAVEKNLTRHLDLDKFVAQNLTSDHGVTARCSVVCRMVLNSATNLSKSIGGSDSFRRPEALAAWAFRSWVIERRRGCRILSCDSGEAVLAVSHVAVDTPIVKAAAYNDVWESVLELQHFFYHGLQS